MLLDWVTPQTPQLTPISPLYRYCRPEDAGALLFMSSNTAIKATGERVREAKALLEGLIVSFEERDVFINHEYANQLRRLEGTQSGNGSKAALPELPQLYLNGQRIGSLAEMKALNEDGQLSARLDEFRMEYIYDAGEVDCAACGGKRFVVCSTCSGTKRGRIMFGKAMKCAMCNENGLMACPSCNTDELERSMTMAPAGYSGKLDRRSIVRS